ncbi:MAG: hypothetical protein WBK14_09215, partial [Bacteroidales bacterium]
MKKKETAFTKLLEPDQKKAGAGSEKAGTGSEKAGTGHTKQEPGQKTLPGSGEQQPYNSKKQN